MLMSWEEASTLTKAFEHARETAQLLHPHWRLGTDYGSFAAALTRQQDRTLLAVTARLRRIMSEMGANAGRAHPWGGPIFSVDGTRLEAPHVQANEEAFGCAGREKTGPQVFLTALVHLDLGLPWDFRLGPGTDSERRHLDDMVESLPEGSLLLADAGFASYALCRRLIESRRHFLLRVGGNVHLLETLGFAYDLCDDLVYLWPQKHRNEPPLVLRLIRFVDGKQEVCLLTDLDQQRLPDAQGSCLYGRRWNHEVIYRSYKQTLEHRRLKSRTEATCLAEAAWSFVSLWLLGLMAVREQLKEQQDPTRWSCAKARDAVRTAIRRAGRPNSRKDSRRCSLWNSLLNAVHDSYKRRGSKTARNYPRKKKEKPPGPPKINAAKPAERTRAQGFKPICPVIHPTA